jgi:para-nitrobenzyl esterase
MWIGRWRAVALVLLASVVVSLALASGGDELAGTSWQLVRFRGGDDTVLMPDVRAKYTLAFGTDGNVSLRIDCNRGRGAWNSPAAGQIEFGQMAMTMAACPSPLADRLARSLKYIRSYVLRDGHLFLSLMADGGIFEFEPAPDG